MFRSFLLASFVIGVSWAREVDEETDSVTAGLSFERDVRPILKAACFHCHGESGVREGGLDVRLVRLMREGGDSGAALVPGNPDASLLWEKLANDEMPEGEKKLGAEEKRVIHAWIVQGAPTARPEPLDPEEARFTLEELDHWSFRPVTRPQVPLARARGTSPVDAFVGRRLSDEGLGFGAEADRLTLIRRLSLNLTGLPPSTEDVVGWMDDARPDAYARLVDRLLASPAFGVRWGRHWLDVAGFAETDGGPGNDDPKRPHAWRYRDYVIEAFNANKPVDVFLQEQMAGDEMVASAVDVRDAYQRECLTATGFLRMAPDATQRRNTLTDRNTAVASTLEVVSTAVMGLTIGCAQCHDHKYDPIGADDYYRFRAIFDPAFPLERWQTPAQRLVDLTLPETEAAGAAIEAEAQVLQDDLDARKRALGITIQEQKLADVPEGDREATREAVHTPRGEQTERQRALLDLYPMVKPVSVITGGLLVEYDGPSYRKFQEEQASIDAVRARKPPKRLIMATRESPGSLPVSRILFRGDPESPREEVLPGELAVLRHHGAVLRIPDNDPNHASSGRRLAYARHLTNGAHPLTARVFVNRLWQHHFGRGLVATPNDFGLMGDRPSHPYLLDWLASEFVAGGWDQKRLHRQLVLSRTYRQGSRRRAELDRVDPENRLLGRMNVRRLEAEAFRDALLCVTDQLDRRLGGASVPVTEDSQGKAVLGVQKIRDGLRAGVDAAGAHGVRRSAYVEVQRRFPLNVLGTFDQPVMSPNCEARRPTTVATQALWFLNDPELIAHAERLAERVQGLGTNDRERLKRLFIRLFARPATESEWQECQGFLHNQTAHFRSVEGPRDPAVSAWAALCQVLLASNRFLYVD